MANEFIKAIRELRSKSEKRKFEQSVDLIVNLKDFDIKKDSVNLVVSMPHLSRNSRVLAFLESENPSFDRTITKREMDTMDLKQMKKIIDGYDTCVSVAKLMPELAKKFGRVLGPAGKMPDPKTGGVVMVENKEALEKLASNIRKTTKIKSKEPSIKVMIGKENMKDEDLGENAEYVYRAVLNALPKRNENLRNVLLKFTMSKPVRVMFEKKE